jgi:hypothetical protein
MVVLIFQELVVQSPDSAIPQNKDTQKVDLAKTRCHAMIRHQNADAMV